MIILEFEYKPERKAQSTQWKGPNSSQPKKVWLSWSNVMTMVFTRFKGIMRHKLAPRGQKVKQEYCKLSFSISSKMCGRKGWHSTLARQQLGIPSWRCTGSSCILVCRIFGQIPNSCASTTPLYSLI